MDHQKASKAVGASPTAFGEQLSFVSLGSLYAQNPDTATFQLKTPTGNDIYPDRPGFKASGTSEDAAARISGYSPQMRKMVLDKLRETRAGMTADELADALNLSPFSARPRLSELKRLGEIVSTGERRKNASGHAANVGRIADAPPWQERGAAA